MTFKKNNAPSPPWQAYVGEVCQLPFPFPWLVVASIFFLVGAIISTFVEHNTGLLPMLALFSLLIAAAANAVLLYYRIFTGWLLPGIRHDLLINHDQISAWELAHTKRVFSISRNVTFGLVLGVVVLVTVFHGGMVFRCTAGRILTGVLFFSIGMVGGSMFYVLLALCYTCFKIGQSKVRKISILQMRNSTSKIIPRFTLRVCFIAMLVYLLGISIVPFIPHRQGLPQIAVPAAFGVFLIAYFVISQLGLHQTLRNAKTEKLNALLPKIEDCFAMVIEDPSAENVGRLRNLFDLQKTLNSKPSWNLGWKEIIALFGSIVIPILVAVLQWIVTRW